MDADLYSEYGSTQGKIEEIRSKLGQIEDKKFPIRRLTKNIKIFPRPYYSFKKDFYEENGFTILNLFSKFKS